MSDEKKPANMSNVWIKVAGISGAIAVTVGALGAHALVKKEDSMKEIWKTASQYHFIHTLALGLSAQYFVGKKRTYVCGLFTAGMVLFCGACYGIVILNQKKPLNYAAPFGGTFMILGWLAFAFM